MSTESSPSLAMPNLKAAEAEDRAQRDQRHDRWFRNAMFGSAILVLLLLAGVAGSTLWGGSLAFSHFGLDFLTSTEWDAVNNKFGALVPIYGTLVTSFLALLIAVPVSFGIAIFLTELAPPWLRMPVAAAVELLAGIPSIIYGMWGLFVFGPFMAQHIAPWLNDYLGALPLIGGLFQGPPLGIGMLSAGIVLAIMIIPFITSVMNEVFNSVPTTLKESAYALGNTTWEVVWDIVLPYTRSAVVGGIFLGLGRALGETMAVTFVLGNSQHFSASLLMPSSSIASVIANEFNEAYTDLHRSSLIALGFLLFVVTFIVLAAARLMLLRLAQKEGK
ncbi:phosphate transport system permease protein [Pseudomonas citronellolis]|uniref:Phosphate transport system permease protein n=2 Tax=Pseudomonas TaxID=286 RepID=A0AAQ1KS53_9PSED|nr:MULTISPECIES: phosphate ABC transporter permease subunit PstC [Pseudomonas]MCL6687889.1 phosphate ABC transporter permease subunit PstC [Pseudomonas sp. R3.Fl]MCP1607077.1 phosphate transport system permease protein [Pseudomonas citronellolis]MCP1640854.1 phosphate transport system permease protein [Pseudomonas citronellolis]MCP1657828.1 phosphate transport system permease protein [Pseudomonas citronellolis]MCP1663772.1 phosphate transport system permease protein [Pseudomonas citronellolis]